MELPLRHSWSRTLQADTEIHKRCIFVDPYLNGTLRSWVGGAAAARFAYLISNNILACMCLFDASLVPILRQPYLSYLGLARPKDHTGVSGIRITRTKDEPRLQDMEVIGNSVLLLHNPVRSRAARANSVLFRETAGQCFSKRFFQGRQV